MGLLLGNFFEREDAHLNFSGGNSKILLDKISQDPPDLREVAKCLMEEAQGYKGGWDSLHGERALGLQSEGAGKDQLIHRSPLAPLKKIHMLYQCLSQEKHSAVSSAERWPLEQPCSVVFHKRPLLWVTSVGIYECPAVTAQFGSSL